MRIGKTTFQSLMLLWSSAFLMGSSGDGCCGDCQEALDHMGDNIRGQGCDASRMGNAISTIREDCDDEDFDANIAIGNLVEQCRATSDQTPRVSCADPGANTRIAIDFVNNSTLGDGLGSVFFTVDTGYSGELPTTGLLAPGEEERISFIASHLQTVYLHMNREEDADSEGTMIGDVLIRVPIESDTWSSYSYRRVVVLSNPPAFNLVNFDEWL